MSVAAGIFSAAAGYFPAVFGGYADAGISLWAAADDLFPTADAGAGGTAHGKYAAGKTGAEPGCRIRRDFAGGVYVGADLVLQSVWNTVPAWNNVSTGAVLWICALSACVEPGEICRKAAAVVQVFAGAHMDMRYLAGGGNTAAAAEMDDTVFAPGLASCIHKKRIVVQRHPVLF